MNTHFDYTTNTDTARLAEVNWLANRAWAENAEASREVQRCEGRNDRRGAQLWADRAATAARQGDHYDRLATQITARHDPTTNGGNTMKTTEQQQENVRRWVAALRSGNYAQGRGCLRSADDEFCCLGVANDLFGEWSVPWGQSSVTECWAGPDSDKYIIRDDILEDWFGEIDEHKHNVSWYGFPKHNVSWYGFNNVLAAANDGDDNTPALTFHEIADLIEATLS